MSSETAAKLRRSMQIIPSGTSTAAKSPDRLDPPVTPAFAVSASGATFIDNQGRSWIDCDMGLGAVVWGHAHPIIDARVTEQIARGVLFSVPHVIELQVAERVLGRLQVFEAIRFAKGGADVVSAAVRMARAATGRAFVACGTYHGWHDWAAVQHYGGSKSLGIPAEVANRTLGLAAERFEFAEAAVTGDVAAVVVCPEHWSTGDLHSLRRLCDRTGSMLVFDEVKSGLRHSARGVWHSIGVVPDLLCLSKGLANGYPLAAIVGSRQIMAYATQARVSGTYFTECVGLAAAMAAEGLLANVTQWPSWKNSADRLIAAATCAIGSSEPGGQLTITGNAASFRVHTPGCTPAADPFRRHFMRVMARHGIFSGGFIALSDAHHTSHIDQIEEAMVTAIERWLVRPDDTEWVSSS